MFFPSKEISRTSSQMRLQPLATSLKMRTLLGRRTSSEMGSSPLDLLFMSKLTVLSDSLVHQLLGPLSGQSVQPPVVLLLKTMQLTKRSATLRSNTLNT
jgi:hypothetical protein